MINGATSALCSQVRVTAILESLLTRGYQWPGRVVTNGVLLVEHRFF
jgi:hypothetical protein